MNNGFGEEKKGVIMNNKKTYFFIVHTNDGLWGEFPDFDCAMTDGADLADLLKNAADCLETAIMGYQESGIALPAPSGIDRLEELKAKCDEPVAFVVPVTGYIPGAPARINVTSTADKIDEITAFAKKVGRTRSELMVKATLDYIRSHV